METLAERLRLMRVLAKLKQYQVAQAVGIPQATLCQFELGKRIPGPEMADRIECVIKSLMKEGNMQS
ncbi:MAG: helix-turn-helix domain-containing protein [Dehalococcoidia bacterium]|nr:helix-turn-helix domain-containing protein [Dehalococcoidia bacterium]